MIIEINLKIWENNFAFETWNEIKLNKKKVKIRHLLALLVLTRIIKNCAWRVREGETGRHTERDKQRANKRLIRPSPHPCSRGNDLSHDSGGPARAQPRPQRASAITRRRRRLKAIAIALVRKGKGWRAALRVHNVTARLARYFSLLILITFVLLHICRALLYLIREGSTYKPLCHNDLDLF